MREKAVKCFTSAAERLRGPEGFLASPAFANLRWTLAGDQRREEMRIFGRKLLKRLDGMGMPFYPAVGLMNLPDARHRFVMGADPWSPAESPFLDGSAIEFAHCLHQTLPAKCWELFAEVGFDVARLASIRVMWGGVSHWERPGMFMLAPDDNADVPQGWYVDGRTYRERSKRVIPFLLGELEDA